MSLFLRQNKIQMYIHIKNEHLLQNMIFLARLINYNQCKLYQSGFTKLIKKSNSMIFYLIFLQYLV